MAELTVAALTALAMAVAPALGCSGLVAGASGRVATVIDGDTVVLDQGTVVRLVGIQAPRLSKGRDGVADWPLAETARAALAEMVLGRKVRLAYGGERIDRHGRALAQLFVDPRGRWVQQALVLAGMARAYSLPDNRKCAGELLMAEGRARAERSGLWGDPFYGVRRANHPADFDGLAGRYELAEGRVVTTGISHGRVYLDFGRRWSEDFTAVIGPRALRLFAGTAIEPAGLAGALVRVRGWIEQRGGPLIEVTHPEQIEVLSRP